MIYPILIFSAEIGPKTKLALLQPGHPQEGEKSRVLAAPHQREGEERLPQDRLQQMGRRG